MTEEKKSLIPLIITTSYSTITGAIFGGPMGGITAFGTSLADEYLIRNNYTDKHYFTLFNYWQSVVSRPILGIASKLVPSDKIYLVASYALSTAFSYIADDFFNFEQKFNTPIESFVMINQLFDRDNILSYQEAGRLYNASYENPSKALSLFKEDAVILYKNPFLKGFVQEYSINLGRILLNQVFIAYFAKYSGNLMLQTIFAEYKAEQVLAAAGRIVGWFCLKSVTDNILMILQSGISNSQFELIMTTSNEIMLTNNNGRKILAHARGKELNDNFMYDLWMLNNNGVAKLHNAMSEITTNIFAFKVAITKAPTLLAIYSSTIIPQHLIYPTITSYTKELAKNITDIEEKTWDVRIDVRENIEQINLRDGENYISHKSHALSSQKHSLEVMQKQLSTIYYTIGSISSYINYFFALLSVVKSYDNIKISTIPFLSDQVSTVYEFYSSNFKFAMQSNDIYISMERLKILFELINSPDNNHARKILNNN